MRNRLGGNPVYFLSGSRGTQRTVGNATSDLTLTNLTGDFFSVPTIDPSIPSAEEAPTDGYFASAKTKNPVGTKDLLTYLASPKQQQAYIEGAGSSNLPTSPDVDPTTFSPLVQKGIKLLQDTKEITQFFNRDSSDALQTTADTALTRFLDHPEDVATILKTWQAAAQKIWNS